MDFLMQVRLELQNPEHVVESPSSGCKEVVVGTFNETVIKSAGELQASLVSKQQVRQWHYLINGAPGKVSSYPSPGVRNYRGFIW